MKNRGYMTIFVSMLLAALVVVFLVIFKIVDIASARSKAEMSVRTACSSVKAQRTNEFIFDRYHILLIDMNQGGDGEEGISRDVKSSLEYNLGSAYGIGEVNVSGRAGILDDDCSAFKEQINDYFLYGVTDYVVNDLIRKTNGKDKPVSDDLISEMDSDVEGVSELTEEDVQNSLKDQTNEDNQNNNVKKQSEKANNKKDPRKEVRKVKKAGIGYFILPEGIEFSDNEVNLSDMPSYGRGGWFNLEVDTNFDNYTKLKKQMNKSSGWLDSLITDAESIAYAHRMFNSLTDEKYDDTYLKLEMEYIICGEATDAENYRKVVDQIMVIRFCCNFVFLLMDSEKMAELDILAAGLTFYFPAIKPVVKYLLAGCWAYEESVADVYCLVRGHKIPYLKNSGNWKTSIYGISELSEIDIAEGDEDESGMDYNDYLMILMALNMKTAYYRMLDVIQLNASQISPDFKMSDAAVAYGVDTKISYKEGTFNLHGEDGY